MTTNCLPCGLKRSQPERSPPSAASRLRAVLLGNRGGKRESSSLLAARCLTGSTVLMVMGDVKMASELLAEAPLASTDEDFSDFNCNKVVNHETKTIRDPPSKSELLEFTEESNLGAFSVSLEDLVSSFDDKITECLRDYDQTTDQLAPVQIRSQEEIMKTDQVWWTLTGNYGNIMPIDWSKSCARKMQLDALNINEQYNDCQTLRNSLDSSDEEDIDRDLDLHSLILSSLQSEPPLVQSAEEVIQQLEDIMAESCSSDDGIASGETTPVKTPDRVEESEKNSSLRAQIAGLIRSDRIKSLSVAELVEVHSALEREIQTLSETLVAELAQRDELDFEKETKNTFISLLLTVQNKRRQYTIDRKKGRGHTIVNGEPKYLTTVIPYNPAVGSKISVSEIQILIKILHAINDDSPTVPTLLTDYILKVLCPT